MRGKLFIVWLLSLLCIPLFSFYGRSLQFHITSQYSTESLSLYLGVMLSSVVIVFCVSLIRSGLDLYCCHLIWVAVLSLLLYAHLPFVEKIHVALFGMFGFLSQRMFDQRVAALLCVGIAGLDELLQHFLVTRVGDWRDVWLNLFSASLGMLLGFFLFDSRSRKAAGDAARP